MRKVVSVKNRKRTREFGTLFENFDEKITKSPRLGYDVFSTFLRNWTRSDSEKTKTFCVLGRFETNHIFADVQSRQF